MLSKCQRDLVSLRDAINQSVSTISYRGACLILTLRRDSVHWMHLLTQDQNQSAYLQSLCQLLTHSIEAISFILLLIEFNLSQLITTLPPQVQQDLLKLTWQGLLTTDEGKVIASELVTSVIKMHINKGESVEGVGETLQRKCGNFCSAEDVLVYKVSSDA